MSWNLDMSAAPRGRTEKQTYTAKGETVTLAEMSEAIPPAYSEFIGRAAIAHIAAMREAA